VVYAKQLGALLFYVEHRSFGKSHLFADLSVENLTYLTSAQALADLARFQRLMSAKYSTGKWATIGGSYPGSLSAWARQQYPNSFAGSIAHSAPVEAVLDFSSYLDVVVDSLTTMNNASCVSNIAKATAQLEQMIASNQGIMQMSSTFQLCSGLDIQNRRDVQTFFESLASNFQGVVQYNLDNRGFEDPSTKAPTISQVCAIMNDGGIAEEWKRYAAVNRLLLNVYGAKCLDATYNGVLNELKDLNTTNAARSWVYMTATAFGYLQSSDSTKQPFGQGQFPLEYSIAQQLSVYGPSFTQQYTEEMIAWTNTQFGAKDFIGSNVLFVNGLVDPWHVLSVLKDVSPTVQTAIIPQGAHCSSMYPASPDDSPEQTAARVKILKLLTEWLA
jgi:hypothetical protein